MDSIFNVIINKNLYDLIHTKRIKHGGYMKKQNIYLKLSVKYIYYFLLFIVFSYFLSHILVEGSEIISVAINDMFEGKFVNLKSIFLQY